MLCHQSVFRPASAGTTASGQYRAEGPRLPPRGPTASGGEFSQQTPIGQRAAFLTSTGGQPPPSALYSVTVSDSTCWWLASSASCAASSERSFSKTSSCDTTP